MTSTTKNFSSKEAKTSSTARVAVVDRATDDNPAATRSGTGRVISVPPIALMLEREIGQLSSYTSIFVDNLQYKHVVNSAN